MSKSKLLYRFLLAVSGCFVAYVVYINFIHDPQAEEFLSHKLNLKHVVNPPVWLTVMNVHVAFACIAMLGGAVNFSNKVQRNHRKLHRINGYVYIVSVMIVVLTSGYMATYATGGKPISMAFNMLNILWPFMTFMALIQIKKKQFYKHRRWMVRSYAFCFTNMCIHMITFVLHKGFGAAYTTSYTVGVYGSILFLLLLGEIVNRTIFTIPVKIDSEARMH